MDLYKDVYKSNTIEKNDEAGSPIKIEYLMHQYPWFTREQIVEAVEKEEHKLGKILAILDHKSGSYPEWFGF
jgi:hypothetical protein